MSYKCHSKIYRYCGECVSEYVEELELENQKLKANLERAKNVVASFRRVANGYQEEKIQALISYGNSRAAEMRERAAKVAEEYPSTRTECEDGVCGNGIASEVRSLPAGEE